MIRKRTNQEQREAFEELQQRKKENWRTQEIGRVWTRMEKQDLESAEKIKTGKM